MNMRKCEMSDGIQDSDSSGLSVYFQFCGKNSEIRCDWLCIHLLIKKITTKSYKNVFNLIHLYIIPTIPPPIDALIVHTADLLQKQNTWKRGLQRSISEKLMLINEHWSKFQIKRSWHENLETLNLGIVYRITTNGLTQQMRKIVMTACNL